MEYLSSIGTGISQVASDLSEKVDKMANDYQIKQKLDSVADSAEEKFSQVSGAYRKLVLAYLTDIANGLPPADNMIHEAYSYSDENGSQGRDYILSPLNYEGRQCAGTVQVFEEAGSFGFRMSQTISVDVQGEKVQLDNVITFGLITCAETQIKSHQQRGDQIDVLLAKSLK